MVQSKAATVPAYLAETPAEWAGAARRLRTLARAALGDHQEAMHWGMPAYLRGGRMTFAFAVQKQYLALYFREPGVLERHGPALAGVGRGKACLRFRKTAVIDWDLLADLLAETGASARSAPPTD